MFLGIILLLTGRGAWADVHEDLAEFFRRAEHYGFSGTVLVAREGEVLLEGAYGFANHERGLPTRLQTAFDVGSITKQFTAAAILHLEAAGQLSVHDSLSEHLDFVPQDKRAVTLHHLLSHTSGLADGYWDLNRDLSEEEYLRKLLGLRARTEPGESFSYSNFGYHLLKLTVERVSGDSYEQYLRENLFLPLDMKHTGFFEPQWAEGQVAQYQDWTTRGSGISVQNPLQRPKYLQPEGSGGILSTARDLYTWHVALEENSVLSEGATTRMFTPNLRDYGYGWRIIKTARDTKLIEHGGYDNWLGVLAGFYRFVDEDVTVIVLANTVLNGSLRHESIVPEIERIVFGDTFAMPPAPRAAAVEILTQYGGTYKTDAGYSFDLVIRNERLNAIAKSPDAIRLLMFPDTGDTEVEMATTATTLIEDLHSGKFDTDEHSFDPRLDAERFVRTWSRRLPRLERNHGALQRIVDLCSYDFVSNGELGSHHYVYIEFAEGHEMLRGTRTQAGWIDLSGYSLPSQLELPLAPTGEGAFHSWNFRNGTGTGFLFSQEREQQLVITGARARTTAHIQR